MGRFFIAIVPQGLAANGQLKQLIGKMKRTLSERGREVRWTPPEMYHLTVQFMGELEEDRQKCLFDLLQEWKPDVQGLTLGVHGVGAFPAPEHARVLWLGVQANQELLNLQMSLSHKLLGAGFELEEREYQPHITLARLRNAQSVINLLNLGGRKKFGEYPIQEIILFESVLQGNMPKYIPRLRRRFGD